MKYANPLQDPVEIAFSPWKSSTPPPLHLEIVNGPLGADQLIIGRGMVFFSFCKEKRKNTVQQTCFKKLFCLLQKKSLFLRIGEKIYFLDVQVFCSLF